MRSFATVLTTLLLILFATITSSPPLLAAGQKPLHRSQQPGLKETRQQAAERQMREYQKQLSTRGRTTSALQHDGAKLSISSQLRSASTIFFSDGMESGINGWTVETHTDTVVWHQTEAESNSPTHSWWTSNELTGNYSNNRQVNQSLISPPINLSGGAGPVALLFTESYVTEAGWDFCMVDVTTDNGTTWIPLRGTYGNSVSGNSLGWVVSTLDLTAFVNQTISIRFHFDTHDSLYNVFPGWFVDNVYVVDQVGYAGGKVFFDVNANGTMDSLDTGLQGWQITAQSGDVVISTRTNWAGDYQFTLPLGSYTITETNPAGWTAVAPSSAQRSVVLTTPGERTDTAHFANWHPAALVSGFVFNDINNNGLFDSTDTTMPRWLVVLDKPIDYEQQYTNGDGYFTFVVTDTGEFGLYQAGWAEYQTQTLPANGEGYQFHVTDLSSNLSGYNFGNFFAGEPPPGPRTCYISGQIFNDTNRTGYNENHEPGLSNIDVTLSGAFYATTLSDSNGHFLFGPLPAGNYSVQAGISPGWWRSNPDAYFVTLPDSTTVDTVALGLHTIIMGGIAGGTFNDRNINTIPDVGEEGLSGWTIHLSGTNAYSQTVSAELLTDSSGAFNFSGLWPGVYTISQDLQSRWRQTKPELMKPYTVHLGPETTPGGYFFGNYNDTTFYISFRSFLPESIALAKDLAGKRWDRITRFDKPIRVAFTEWLRNNDHERVATKLNLAFGLPILGELTVSVPCTQIFNLKRTTVELSFPSGIPPESTVTISGFAKPKMNMVQFPLPSTWTYVDLTTAPAGGSFWSSLVFPTPNAVNVLAAGAGNQIMVGLGAGHSVYQKDWKAIGKSLIDKHGMHAGDPRCLATYAAPYNKAISYRKPLTTLPPTKGNNILFAEQLALKVNIKASDFLITPIGFGDLIFDEGGDNPFNGKSVRFIASVVDTFMSVTGGTNSAPTCVIPAGYEALDAWSIWRTIRKIDSAFCGPLSFSQITPVLVATPMRSVLDVPYLHIDSSFSGAGRMIAHAVQMNEEPDRFTLEQNYPNPFNPTTTISFNLPSSGMVTLKIYNTLGQEVATVLNNEQMEDGYQEVEFNASSFASGVYFYRIEASIQANEEDGITAQRYTSVRKMMLIK